MRTTNAVLVWIISWIMSGLILIPCTLLSIISGFKVDYHHKFHLWWAEEVLDKL